MTKEPVADWAAARSDKWRRQMTGMEAMLAPIDGPLIEALDLDRPLRIADVGCGGGATSVETLRRAPSGSLVHGFDLSPALVEVARRRGGSRNGALAFDVANMEHKGPPGLRYERLVSRLGVMFFGDPVSAFRNLRRWLVPAGRFAFAVWGPIEDNAWMTVTRAAVADVIDLPPIGQSGPGPFRYSDAATLRAVLEKGGFTEIDVSEWTGRLAVGGRGTSAAAAQFALASFSSFSELLKSSGADASVLAQRALTERFSAFEQDGAVLMNARVHIVSGAASSRSIPS